MENQRTRIVKKMLKDALVSLLQEKALYHITVKEICTHAEVNRSTFYKYYGSPKDLLDDIIHDFDEESASFFQNAPETGKKGKRLIAYLNFLMQNKDVFLLLSDRNITSINSPMQLIIEKEIISPHQNTIYPDEYRYIADFYAGGVGHIIRSWIAKESPEPTPYIAELITKLCVFDDSIPIK